MSADKITAALKRKGIRLDVITYERSHPRGWHLTIDRRDRAKLARRGFTGHGTKKRTVIDTLPEVFEWIDTLPMLKTQSRRVITYTRVPCGLGWLNIEDPA